MSEDNALVLVAGYQDLDSARHDFQTLVDAAKDKSIPLQGAVLIGKDAEGSPVLVDTGNRLGRRGAAWGAGVGLAIGLFSPALLASAALGAATGALAGTFAHHRIKTGLADKIGQALAAGRAVVIAVTEAQGRLEAGQALASSPMKSVAELSRSTLRSLGAALREAMGKSTPAPPRPAATAAPLWWRGWPHHGRVGRRLVDCPRSLSARRRTECADRVDR
ncbi:sulfatase [Mycobacterium tuberculosis]|nr:sulfatase [Mycobacterium tuberculosis]